MNDVTEWKLELMLFLLTFHAYSVFKNDKNINQMSEMAD